MPNLHRGDVPFVLDGETHALRLTLGGLATLEEALGAETLATLGGKLFTGEFSSRHLCAVLAAGFAGAGKSIAPDALARAIPVSALEAAINAAASLLAQAFGGGLPSRPRPPQATR